MSVIDFTALEQANPAVPVAGFDQPSWADNGAINASGFVNPAGSNNAGWTEEVPSGSTLYAETTVTNLSNSQSRGPALINSSGNGYLLLIRAADARFFRFEGATQSLTQLYVVPGMTSLDGDRGRINYRGAGNFTFDQNGVEQGAFTDTTYTGLKATFVSRGNAATITRFESGSLSTTPTLRKSGTKTIDKPAGIGTITSVTLNGNAITLDSQDAETFTVTDSDASITTSGEYDLVAVGDTTETITVQVNVVGLPANTAKKDGGLLVNLTDVELDAFNAAGTPVKQLTGLTNNASGVISPVDLSDLSEAVGDSLKVSLYSPSQAFGITFTQALELI